MSTSPSCAGQNLKNQYNLTELLVMVDFVKTAQYSLMYISYQICILKLSGIEYCNWSLFQILLFLVLLSHFHFLVQQSWIYDFYIHHIKITQKRRFQIKAFLIFISVSELSANCPILAVRETTVSLSRGDFRVGFFSFLLERKNGGTATSTRVSHPTLKKT